jgi:hypothetical protein
MEGDTLARSSRFSPSTIRAQLKQQFEPARPTKEPPPPPPEEPGADDAAAATDTATPEKPDPLPRPGDAYKVHGRHGNKPDVTIHFVTKDCSYEGFSYAELQRMRLVPGKKPGSGPVMILRFGDTEVTLEGRHLPYLYNWIGLHRVPWVWEHPSPADFVDEKAMLISRITIDHVER